MEEEEEIQKYSGETSLTRVNLRYEVVSLREALEIYNRECDQCEEIKNLAQKRGLTQVVMSGNHLIREI